MPGRVGSLLPPRPSAGFPGFSCPGRDRQTGEPTAHTPGGDGRGLLGSGHGRAPSRARTLPAGGGPGGAGASRRGKDSGLYSSKRKHNPRAQLLWQKQPSVPAGPQAWGSPWATVSASPVMPTSPPTPGCLGPGPAGRLPVCTGQSSIRASRPAARRTRSEACALSRASHSPLRPLHASGPLPGSACLEKPGPGYLLGARPGSAHHDTGFSAQLSLTGGRLPSDNAVPSAVPSARPVSAGGRPPSTARLACLLLAVCGPPLLGAAPWVHPACRCPHAPSALREACVLRECVNEWTAPAHLSGLRSCRPAPRSWLHGAWLQGQGAPKDSL